MGILRRDWRIYGGSRKRNIRGLRDSNRNGVNDNWRGWFNNPVYGTDKPSGDLRVRVSSTSCLCIMYLSTYLYSIHKIGTYVKGFWIMWVIVFVQTREWYHYSLVVVWTNKIIIIIYYSFSFPIERELKYSWYSTGLLLFPIRAPKTLACPGSRFQLRWWMTVMLVPLNGFERDIRSKQ